MEESAGVRRRVSSAGSTFRTKSRSTATTPTAATGSLTKRINVVSVRVGAAALRARFFGPFRPLGPFRHFTDTLVAIPKPRTGRNENSPGQSESDERRPGSDRSVQFLPLLHPMEERAGVRRHFGQFMGEAQMPKFLFLRLLQPDSLCAPAQVRSVTFALLRCDRASLVPSVP